MTYDSVADTKTPVHLPFKTTQPASQSQHVRLRNDKNRLGRFGCERKQRRGRSLVPARHP
jgi:hypothetical protein